MDVIRDARESGSLIGLVSFLRFHAVAAFGDYNYFPFFLPFLSVIQQYIVHTNMYTLCLFRPPFNTS